LPYVWYNKIKDGDYMKLIDEMNEDFEIEFIKRTKWMNTPSNHFHSHYEMYYLLSGEVKYFINDSIYNVKQGTVVMIPPQIIHKSINASDPKHERFLIYFKPEFIKEFLGIEPGILNCFDVNILNIPPQKQSKIEGFFKSMLNEYPHITSQNIVMTKSYFAQLLITLNRYLEDGKIAEYTASELNQNTEKILDIVKFINNNYDKEISLSGLSKEFYISQSYLSRSFKSVTGFTYIEYLNRVRIKKAIELLKSTNMNITEISESVGFSSSNHFCKMFKAIMKISPLKYKKLL